MNPENLRQQHPKFVYENYSYEKNDHGLTIQFSFALPPNHRFNHQISLNLPKDVPINLDGSLDNFVFHLGLSLIPSYWKLTASPNIEISAGPLSKSQIHFWKKLLTKGMGEYFFRNQINFIAPDFLTINCTNPQSPLESRPIAAPLTNSILVPVGGGKDSIVTLELLKPHFNIVPFIINPNQIMLDVLKIAGVSDPITIKSTLDPHLLELNRQGFLNGHVPISAFYSFAAVLSARISGINYIVFSNERSSNEGNTTYLDHEINHQYSKTLEFETDMNNYLSSISNISIFSFLRPLYELQITKLFSNHPEYFQTFSSCNRNFTLTNAQNTKPGLWCNHCPKCISTAMMLGCFIGKQQIIDIMGAYPPDLPENQKIVDQLIGDSPIKPFECVLTRKEARAVLSHSKGNSSPDYDLILSSWEDNPNLPEHFVSILKKS